jgi:hypothetical protein
MRKRIVILLFITSMLLALTQSQEQKIYIPFVYRPLTASISTCNGQILSTVYLDANGDSQRADNEMGMAGVALHLRPIEGVSSTTVRTDRTGRTAIIVPPGAYELRAEKPEGFRFTTTSVWGIDIMCSTIRVEFGLTPDNT